MEEQAGCGEGWRVRKRTATLRRIAEEGLRLFTERGYDETTLEVVAEAAGVSARTLFHYFGTKDEILQYWKGTGFLEAIRPTILAEPADQPPLTALRHAIIALMSRYETEKTVQVDRILNSTEALRVRKQAFYIELESLIFAASCEVWPAPERRPDLRMTAVLGVSAVRLATEARRNDPEGRPLTEHLNETFDRLGAVAGTACR